MGFDTTNFRAALRARVPAVVQRALFAVDHQLAAVMGLAQARAPVGGGQYSPNDPAPGTLAASGSQTPAQLVGNGDVVAEGGFNTIYAARQHEELDYRHETGEAKFLESALRDKAPLFMPFVASVMDAE